VVKIPFQTSVSIIQTQKVIQRAPTGDYMLFFVLNFVVA